MSELAIPKLDSEVPGLNMSVDEPGISTLLNSMLQGAQGQPMQVAAPGKGAGKGQPQVAAPGKGAGKGQPQVAAPVLGKGAGKGAQGQPQVAAPALGKGAGNSLPPWIRIWQGSFASFKKRFEPVQKESYMM